MGTLYLGCAKRDGSSHFGAPRTDLLCPYDQLESVLDQLPQQGDLLIILSLREGARRSRALGWRRRRFEAAINLDGGINEWASGRPVVAGLLRRSMIG